MTAVEEKEEKEGWLGNAACSSVNGEKNEFLLTHLICFLYAGKIVPLRNVLGNADHRTCACTDFFNETISTSTTMHGVKKINPRSKKLENDASFLLPFTIFTYSSSVSAESHWDQRLS